jgi:flagellar basal-body rod protein FlgB
VPRVEPDLFATIENSMRYRVARQGVLAMNIANAETPGYRRGDLVFDERLAAAELARSRDGAGGRALGTHYEIDDGPARPDGNNVIPDREAVLLSRNAGAFTTQAEVLSRLLALRRTAITGGR